MIRLQLAFLTFVVLLSGSTSLLAGPTYQATFAPPPGPGSLYGNTAYNGPDSLSGAINVAAPYGISGSDTPQNSGQVFNTAVLAFSVNGNSGHLNIDSDFIGTIIASNINASGGTAEFEGYLSSAAASFFGVSASTEEVGTLTIQLFPAAKLGAGNDTATAQVVFGPGTTVPEPSSLLLLFLGCLRGAARAGPIWWRTR